MLDDERLEAHLQAVEQGRESGGAGEDDAVIALQSFGEAVGRRSASA